MRAVRLNSHPMSPGSEASSIAFSLILIAAVSAGGLVLGSLKFRGIGLGSAGVLFAGLFAGSLGFGLDHAVLHFLKEFGLLIFVFMMGLQLGPGFFTALRKSGLALNVLALAVVLMGGLGVLLLGSLLEVPDGASVGIFSGATTNTPSLGAAQQELAVLHAPEDQRTLAALAYSASYPVGIASIIASLLLVQRLFRIDPAAELRQFEALRSAGIEPLTRLNVLVDNLHLDGLRLRDLPGKREMGITVSRILRAGAEEAVTATDETVIHVGDHLLLVGTAASLERFHRVVGAPGGKDLMTAPGGVSFRRVVVTNHKLLGKPLAELGLDHLYGVTVTRIVRAGVEMTAVPDIRLQFGDFLHVVGCTPGLDRAADALGNSLKALNETQYIPVFTGMALGVLVGIVPIAVPGLSDPLRLGLAGGPLIVAILLARLGRIGPLVWHMPANTNAAFRDLGVTLFLCCVGLAAGPRFLDTVLGGDGLLWMGCAVIVALVPLLLAGWVARRIFKLNYIDICGLLSGSMTDPPALAFATSLVKSDAPSLAYATVYPATMLARIFVAQLLALYLFA